MLAATIAVPVISAGTVVLADLIFGVAAVSMLFTVASNNVIRNLWIVAGLWSAAQIASNLLHDKGLITAPVLAGPTIIILATTLYWMHTRLKFSVPDLVIAAGIGWIALEFVVGRVSSTDNIWKYSLATPVAITAIAMAYRMQAGKWTVVGILLALTGVSLYYDSRLQMGLFLITALVVSFLATRQSGRRRQTTGAFFAFLAAALGIYLAYPAVAASGLIGERAQNQQIVYDEEGVNFLLATRMEFPQMAYLASNHLGTGIGSYQPIDRMEALAALQFVDENIAPLSNNDETYLLNDKYNMSGYRAHSSAMSSILYAGILAAPFWTYLLFQNGRALWWTTRNRGIAPALLIYMCLLTSWDTFYSPLSNRSHIGLGITFFLLAVVYARNRKVSRTASTAPA